jgi:hypothetical protein
VTAIKNSVKKRAFLIRNYIWQGLEEKENSMLKNYRKNLKYTYKMLYPGFLGVIPSIVLMVLVLGVVIVVYRYVIPGLGIEHFELKFVLTVLVLLSGPFLFITAYSLSKFVQEKGRGLSASRRRLLKLLLYFLFLIFFGVIIFIVISLFLKFIFGIPF